MPPPKKRIRQIHGQSKLLDFRSIKTSSNSADVDLKGSGTMAETFKKFVKEKMNRDCDICNVPADGNCMFHSLALQLGRSGPECADGIRREILDYLGEHREMVSEVMDDMEFHQYLTNMKQSGTFGDGIMLSAAVRLYGRPIVVISPESKSVQHIDGSDTTGQHTPLYLGLFLEHYVSIQFHSSDSTSTTTPSTASQEVSADLSYLDQVKIIATQDKTTPNKCAPADIAQTSNDTLRRPVLSSYPKTASGKQYRSFSTSLYEKYNFIEYSLEADAVYCFPCRFFGSKSGHCVETAFTVDGFRKWKKCERILQHACGKYHIDSTAAWFACKVSATHGTVIEQQLGYHAQLASENREYVKTLLRIAVLCGRQNIALRGHDETDASSNRGNYLELVDLVTAESTAFAQRRSGLPANSKYLSSDSQNALIEAAARCVLIEIQKEIDKSGMYAIISDCCTDMVADNLSLCIRYVDMEASRVYERFIEFSELAADELDASSISSKILAMLQQGKRFNLSLESCVAQTSDGASVMSGKDNGVQKLIRDKVNNPCIFVHCYAHRLNLVLSQSVTEVESAKTFFDLIRHIISFINGSVKRKAVFKEIQSNDPDKPVVVVLPDLCDHKWNFRERAVSVIIARYSHLIETLDVLAENGKKTERFDAECCLSNVMKPLNICLLVIINDVFTQLGGLSDALQAENCDLANALQLASAHTQLLCNKRTDDYFSKLWLKISDIATNSNIDMSLPSKRKLAAPSKLRQFLTESTLGHGGQRDLPVSEVCLTVDSNVQYYKTTVFLPVMDRLIAEMKHRFGDDATTPILQSIAVCHPDSENFLNYDVLRPLVDAYKLDTNGSLRSQIDVCKLVLNSESKPRNIPELISRLVPAAGFVDLRRLLQIALTIPVANVASERSFSSMRKIRTYVRSNMKEQRLTGIALLNIENELSKNIDLDKAIDIFKKLPSLRDTAGATHDETSSSFRRLPL